MHCFPRLCAAYICYIQGAICFNKAPGISRGGAGADTVSGEQPAAAQRGDIDWALSSQRRHHKGNGMESAGPLDRPPPP